MKMLDFFVLSTFNDWIIGQHGLRLTHKPKFAFSVLGSNIIHISRNHSQSMYNIKCILSHRQYFPILWWVLVKYNDCFTLILKQVKVNWLIQLYFEYRTFNDESIVNCARRNSGQSVICLWASPVLR